MRFALHGMCSLYSNVMSDIRLARDTGYEGLEIHTDKLWRYINAGMKAKTLKQQLDKFDITPSAIDIIGSVEVPGRDDKAKLFKRTEALCDFAQQIGASTIQLNAFEALNGLSVESNIELTAKNIRSIADIGRQYGIRFQFEGAAWTPIAALDDFYRLRDAVSRDNFGLVIDTWHFWAGRGATPEQITKIDKTQIYNVHVSDGIRPSNNAPWPDEKSLRGYFLGQGKIPLKEWVDAIVATGYDGFFSAEFLNDQMWEHDHTETAEKMLYGMKSLF
ncbi:Inosose isomerase [Vibrio thalassae]|uniref:Inosose isomerase n=1 Tax=Vibrio thalassae TaxID=1243014 RepID=A0A240ELX2_9VIBR|nr:sugar phosphate isomerase/epimerase family protein [Vibrio thalassae]SNX49491.1 Inosose isomerase [Vibrio thalassae]